MWGGDCSSVQAELVEVQTVSANKYAFAALKRPGEVVVWGYPGCGGACSRVQKAELVDVVSLRATREGFAAVTRSGSVVTWGPRRPGSPYPLWEFDGHA